MILITGLYKKGGSQGVYPSRVSITYTYTHTHTHKLSLTPIYYDEEAIRATHILQKRKKEEREVVAEAELVYMQSIFGLFLTDAGGTKIQFLWLFFLFFH